MRATMQHDVDTANWERTHPPDSVAGGRNRSERRLRTAVSDGVGSSVLCNHVQS